MRLTDLTTEIFKETSLETWDSLNIRLISIAGFLKNQLSLYLFNVNVTRNSLLTILVSKHKQLNKQYEYDQNLPLTLKIIFVSIQ